MASREFGNNRTPQFSQVGRISSMRFSRYGMIWDKVEKASRACALLPPSAKIERRCPLLRPCRKEHRALGSSSYSNGMDLKPAWT
jgi:hypothetical protein